MYHLSSECCSLMQAYLSRFGNIDIDSRPLSVNHVCFSSTVHQMVAVRQAGRNFTDAPHFQPCGCLFRRLCGSGCVAIFVVLGFKCKVISNMTAVIDDLMECLTIEIKVERAKNILIICIFKLNSRIYSGESL